MICLADLASSGHKSAPAHGNATGYRTPSSRARATRAGPVRDLELAEHRALMGLHGVNRDVEVRGDLTAGQLRGHQSQDFEFLAGELLDQSRIGTPP